MSQSSNEEKPEFWLINISKRNVCLSDLALTIGARRSMNLLDKDHFDYTYEQLKKSMESGSIFKKSHLVKVGDRPVNYSNFKKREISKRPIMIRKRTIVEADQIEEDYDEIIWSDEQYAEEMSKDFGFDDLE